MTLSPETAALMVEFAKTPGPALQDMSVEDARALSVSLTSLGLPAVPVARSEDIALPVDGSSILVRVLEPVAPPRGVMVFLHGGGWVIGSVAEWTALGTRLAEATGCIVVLPDYRMAPEVRFPVPVEDCWAALLWAAGRYNLPLLVAGDSAGGNLTAVLAIRARDAGAPQIEGQALIYPVTDHDPERPSWLAEDNQHILTAAGMSWFWTHYIEAPEDRHHPEASPLRAASLAGLPPTYLLLAEHDVLHDEGAAYGDRLLEAGVPLERDYFVGETHGFLTLGAALPAAGRAIGAIGGWAGTVLDRTSPTT